MGLLSDGMTWLGNQLAATESVPVTYTRGAYSCMINATLGSQLLRITDTNGRTRVQRPDQDFIFNATELVLNSLQVEPDEGDHITKADGTRYEVRSPAVGEAAWRYCEPQHVRIRVHTKKRTA